MWNLRDTHMMETPQALLAHIRQVAGEGRAVIWAHNSHLGDARATQMGESGELNLGQLVRQAYGPESRLIGFTTHPGTVTVASNWDEPAQRKRVRPSLAGSVERLFHDVGIGQFQLELRDPATGRRCRTRDWSARSASSTGPRPNAPAITSAPMCRSSSTRSCTLTRPMPSSRSSPGRSMKPTCLRPIRRRYRSGRPV